MRVLTHHIPANAGNMQELYKRKKAVIQTPCLLALFGMYHLPAFPKNNDASLPIDTLIIRIPSVMRSDEAAAKHMIAALEKKSLQTQLNRGIAMPLLVGFIGSQARHFILVLHYTQTNGSYRYLVYDPGKGVVLMWTNTLSAITHSIRCWRNGISGWVIIFRRHKTLKIA